MPGRNIGIYILYDLNTDQRERNNLANERREVKDELLTRLKTWEEQFEATR